MQIRFKHIVLGAILSLAVLATSLSAQTPVEGKAIVENGVLRPVYPTAEEDSIAYARRQAQLRADSLEKAADTLSKREYRRMKKALEDTSSVRYGRYFRDSISLSKMCWISTVVPGFGQFYNEQYWKIPIAYTALGLSTWGTIVQNKKYQNYKSQYDALQRINASRETLTPVQTQMIRYNTKRQIMIGALAASYIYFIGDAAVNYKGENSNVKKATTLSTICPGAGQFYNESYWKIPIVLGGIATFAFVIDYNQRGYERFTLAYDLLTDGDDSTVDEFNGRYSSKFIDNYRDSYRRNRDLGLILMAGWYLFNIIDAHVDAHFKNYDISDDLTIKFEPRINTHYSQRLGSSNTYSMSLNLMF